MTKKQTLQMILKYVSKYWYLAICTILFAIITVISMLLVPIYIGKIIDVVISVNNVDLEFIMNTMLKIIIFILITFIFQWFLGIINNYITYNITFDIRRDAFNKIIKLPLKYIDSHQYGEVVSKVITDVDSFADGLLMGFTELFTGICTIIGTLILMLKINWIIALLVVVLTPISIVCARFIARGIHKYFIKQSEVRAEETGFIDEMITNMKVVQAFSHEDENMVSFKEVNNRLIDSSLKAVFFSSLVNPVTRFVNAIIYACVALSGAFIILKSPWGLVLSVGSLATLLSYSKEYSKPFNDISSVITELQNAFACAQRVFTLIDEKEEETNYDDVDINEETNKVKGNIDFKNVCFSYNKDQKLIENLNLEVKSGMRVAIVGPTGCGKTTLINLIMRFYDPQKGNIDLDGYNTLKITRKSLRSNFGMVLQDTWLKSGTIMDNIKFGKPEATDEEVYEACKIVRSHNFIMRLKDGYNTYISEAGGNLSTGQKQLLCISRIMLMMPPMLILDEATSSIDTRTELKIQNAFAILMKGKTSFIVAHRLQTIKEADVILVMKDGSIIEKGNHQQLINKKGFYYQMYNSQFEN